MVLLACMPHGVSGLCASPSTRPRTGFCWGLYRDRATELKCSKTHMSFDLADTVFVNQSLGISVG